MPPHRNAYRPVVMGTGGVVTSAHPLASAAGLRMLLAGGNAVDAAVATAAALNVVEPFMSGLGGNGLALISRGGERLVLDFLGHAPAAADPAAASEAELGGGPKSCATAGNLAGWLTLLERFGSMARADVLAPAIDLAERGAPLTVKGVEFFESGRARLAHSAEAERLYLAGTPRPGAVVRYPELAATLRLIAEGGREPFYRGPVARAIAAAVQAAGGWLTEADLAVVEPTWREPIAVEYRGHAVATVPPPGSIAFQMLETLGILEGFDLAAWGHGSVEHLHHLIEAVKLASADRLAYGFSADPPLAGLLSRGYAAAQRARIDPRRAGRSEGERHSAERLPDQIREGHPPSFVNEQTTHFACADAAGTVVSVTQTLGAAFGSGLAVPGTGVLLNNHLQWMDRDPVSPNVLRGGRKLAVNMAPTQVFRDGRFALSIGTPGSYGIVQTTPQMISNVLDFGLNVQEAIEAPRVRVYRDRLVDAEARIPAETRAALADRGHQVNAIAEWSWVVGGGQGIARDPESGALMAGADPRRDGYAIAI
jgi:gamma-glutamyltranspeptidase / glutathione hydrolase